MKTFLPSLVFFIFVLPSVFAQTTPIPDSAFEQALIIANIDNNGFNGNILNSDAAPVTFLDLDSLGIADLSGIEAFVNLSWLEAKANDIASIDLTANTQLKFLVLSFNQLSGIDLSQNTLLADVNLEGNAISSIDVSELDSLDDLAVGGNLLTSLDVSQNPVLTALSIWNTFTHQNHNQISSLDLSANPLLRRLLVLNNQMTSLDVSQNPELFTLNCSDNLIPQLDLSNNANLNTLGCSNNLLTELDVAHLDLQALNCNDNQISGFLDLAASPDLVLLICNNNQIDSIALPPSPFMINLYVSNNALSSLDVSHLGIIQEFICHNNQLKSLNMRNGTNTFLQSFTAYNNPELSCIQVDDVAYATATFINAVDSGLVFSEACATVGLDEIVQRDTFSIFPNPASDFLYGSVQAPVKDIVIFDVYGKMVHRASGFPVSLRALIPGLYVIQLTTQEKEYVGRFIKSE